MKLGDTLATVSLIGENKRAILYFAITQSDIPLDPENLYLSKNY